MSALAQEVKASAQAASLAVEEARHALSELSGGVLATRYTPLTSNDVESMIIRNAVAVDRRRVIVLGDPGVGKTSFIAAARSESDDRRLPHPHLFDPPDASSIRLTVMLSLSLSFTAIALAFRLDDDKVVTQSSMKRLKEEWLPALAEFDASRRRAAEEAVDEPPTKTSSNISEEETFVVVLVALENENENEAGSSSSAGSSTTLETSSADTMWWCTEAQRLMAAFPFVEAAFRCSPSSGDAPVSALTVINEIESAAENPMRPLYEYAKGALTFPCARALGDVFDAFDVDGDGRLSNTELKRFQQEAFDVEIGELEIVALHERLLAESVHNVGMTHRGRSDTDVGTVVSGIRLRGFLALFRAMLEEHTDAASVWRVLRRFSYARATAAKCAHLDVSTMSGREERLQRILAAAEREGSETAMATTDTPAKWRRGAKVTDL